MFLGQNHADTPPPMNRRFTFPFGSSTATAISSPKDASAPHACTIATIAEAARLPSRNPKFAVLLFHLAFVPFALLTLLRSVVDTPLLERIEDEKEISSHDVRAIVVRESAFFLLYTAVSFFGMTVIVRGSDLVYTGIDEGFGVRELMTRVCSAWRMMPFAAWLLASVLTLAYVIAAGGIVRSANDVSIWLSCLAMVLAVVGYLLFSSIGNLLLVVSMLEDEIGNLKSAAMRSWKLMRGRRKGGFVLMLVLEMMSTPIYLLFSVTTTDDDDALGLITRLGFGYVATALFCIAVDFKFMAFTLFYDECLKNHRVKLGTELGNGGCYNAVVPDGLDSSIP